MGCVGCDLCDDGVMGEAAATAQLEMTHREGDREKEMSYSQTRATTLCFKAGSLPPSSLVSLTVLTM